MNSETQPSRKHFSMPFMNGGTSLLLAVLLVLVLVVLSLLSLSAARSDREFSQNIAEKTTQYYDACSRAEETLAQVQQQLKKTNPDFSGLDVSRTQEEICWETEITPQQVLQSAVNRETGEVVRWQVVSSDTWTEQDSFSVPLP